MSENCRPDEPKVIYPTEETWFAFSATLRIHGEGLDFDEISRTLGVQPTYTHRKGECNSKQRPDLEWKDDAWHYGVGLDESRPLQDHILALWQVLKFHVPYLKALKERFKVDTFCGYRSNNQTAGFEVDYRCLEMFTALEIPFGLSIITL